MSKTQRSSALTLQEALEALSYLPAVVAGTEAARALGVHERTLRRWRDQGRVRCLKTTPGNGGKLRYLRRDLAQLLVEMAG